MVEKKKAQPQVLLQLWETDLFIFFPSEVRGLPERTPEDSTWEEPD